ncbi:thiol:disulfide interchange protein DsbA/DsbL [Streptacidiphilus sp. EB129]|uniref:thiol:disulfide interchange protein DsbA/DsbL n=1 Tax=Streptacidiphilus sp. EB129 TaxID=3156262 RepID=UPI003511B477
MTSFTKPLVRAMAALALTSTLIGLQAPAGTAAAPPIAGAQYVQGVQYVQLQHPVPASPREVTEIFWYNCPHSYLLAQPLRDWAARQNPPVTIRHIPAAWPDRPDMMGYARVYYTLDRLGLADSMEQAVFHAVRDEHWDLTQPDALSEWAQLQGIDEQQLMDAWNSPEVQQEVQAAPALRERYEVHEMPSVIIGGTYRTSPFIAPGGVQGTVPVVDYLLRRSR